MATKAPERVRRLVLVGPVGVKTGPTDKLDIPDIFAMPQDELQRLIYHDPDKMRAGLRDADRRRSCRHVVRNRETLALLAWEPYMHNPKLRHRLHRVNGARAVPARRKRRPGVGRISRQPMRRLLPNARTDTIAEAGHAPQIEQPDAFAATVLEFLDDSPDAQEPE